MTTHDDADDGKAYRLNRRTAMKAAGLAGMGMFGGTTMFAGSVGADTPNSGFPIYAVEHHDQESPYDSRTDRLIVIDSNDLSDGDIFDPIMVETFDLVNEVDNPTNIATGTLAAAPDGGLYGLNRAGDYGGSVPGSASDSRVFRIEPPESGDTTVTLEFHGDGNAALREIWASAFDLDGNWFGVSGESNALYEIDPDTGETEVIGDLTLDGDEYDAVHVGMGVNFLTGELWLVAGNKPTGQSDIFKVNTEDGSLELAPDGEDALTAGGWVGAAFGPCANILHVVRNSNNFYGFDVSDGKELEFGSLQYEVGDETIEVAINNLAVPYGIECFGDICGEKTFTDELEEHFLDLLEEDNGITQEEYDDRYAGWKFELFDADDVDLESPLQTVETDTKYEDDVPVAGEYCFAPVPEGDYVVCETSNNGTEVVEEHEGEGCKHVTVKPGMTTGVDDSQDTDFENDLAELQGCTPGFWCNPAQKKLWWTDSEDVGGYTTDEIIGDIFNADWETFDNGGRGRGRPGANTDPADRTLGEAVCNLAGGPDLVHAQAQLAGHATAALLNAAHEFISYGMSEDDIIDAVVDVVNTGDRADVLALKDTLDDYNNMGCTLNAFGVPEE